VGLYDLTWHDLTRLWRESAPSCPVYGDLKLRHVSRNGAGMPQESQLFCAPNHVGHARSCRSAAVRK